MPVGLTSLHRGGGRPDRPRKALRDAKGDRHGQDGVVGCKSPSVGGRRAHRAARSRGPDGLGLPGRLHGLVTPRRRRILGLRGRRARRRSPWRHAHRLFRAPRARTVAERVHAGRTQARPGRLAGPRPRARPRGPGRRRDAGRQRGRRRRGARRRVSRDGRADGVPHIPRRARDGRARPKGWARSSSGSPDARAPPPCGRVSAWRRRSAAAGRPPPRRPGRRRCRA